MVMIVHNARASGKGDALHLFPSYPPYARAKPPNPERRDAHQEMVMRVPTRRRMVPSGKLGPKTVAWQHVEAQENQDRRETKP